MQRGLNQTLQTALEEAGLELKKTTIKAVGEILSDIIKDIEGGRQTREEGDLEGLPEEFFIEVPVILPAGLTSRGTIEIYPDESEAEDIGELVEASVKEWKKGNLNFYVWEDEEAEEPILLEPSNEKAKIKVVRG